VRGWAAAGQGRAWLVSPCLPLLSGSTQDLTCPTLLALLAGLQRARHTVPRRRIEVERDVLLAIGQPHVPQPRRPPARVSHPVADDTPAGGLANKEASEPQEDAAPRFLGPERAATGKAAPHLAMAHGTCIIRARATAMRTHLLFGNPFGHHQTSWKFVKLAMASACSGSFSSSRRPWGRCDTSTADAARRHGVP
jgi:hypothetical protein